MVSTDRLFGANSSLAIKVPCKAATTANITLSGEQTIDGVAIVSGDRVLVKNQTTGSQNGIYIADTSTWDRAPDFDGSNDVVSGTQVLITSGNTYTDFVYKISNDDPITIGTTSLTFERITSPVGEGAVSYLSFSELSGVKTMVFGDQTGVLRTMHTSGPNVGDNRSWLPGGVISYEIGDSADIAAWRCNGTVSSLTSCLAQDHISQFYGSGIGSTLIIPNSTTPIYSGYDGEDVHTVSGLGPYSYATVGLGAESDVACYAYNSGDPFTSYRLLVKTTDYTLNLGAKELTLTGAIAENRIVIRRRRDWAGSGPFLGRSGETVLQATGNYSDKSRPTVMIWGVAQSGEVVARPRAFMKGPSIVFMGRGSHEDVSGAGYPDNKNIGNSSYNKWRGFQGSVFPDTYTPKGVVEVWSPDVTDTAVFNGVAKSALAAISLRKGTDPSNTGFDFGTAWADQELNFYVVNSGTRTKVGHLSLAGTFECGRYGGTATLRATAVSNAANGIEMVGALTTAHPYLQAYGTDTNIDFEIKPKGTGVVRFGAWTSSGDAAVNGYITMKDNAGNTRKLATIA